MPLVLVLTALTALAHPGGARADTCVLPDPSAPCRLVFEENVEGRSLDREARRVEGEEVSSEQTYPILDLAVGGRFPGEFEIDRVRVWQR